MTLKTALKSVLREQNHLSTQWRTLLVMMRPSQETPESIDVVDSMTAVEYDVEEQLFQATYDQSSESATLAVVAVIETATSKDPLELAPLHYTIDGDALDDLFTNSINGTEKRDSTSFEYEGFEVTVFSEGRIEAKRITGA
ncbi:HalOD1 output domain-containing protein [Halomontanus rarus]|uniref:HalOD1 output domain-containing protein n=1 Tax=Halomontanus rarus TaxID=3034020 RepID=UPI00293BCCBA|nr:HalOD1 output domain-containing protein [Halovivax sp. KZCA124]